MVRGTFLSIWHILDRIHDHCCLAYSRCDATSFGETAHELLGEQGQAIIWPSLARLSIARTRRRVKLSERQLFCSSADIHAWPTTCIWNCRSGGCANPRLQQPWILRESQGAFVKS